MYVFGLCGQSYVVMSMEYLWQACTKHGIKLVGHAHGWDGKVRNALYQLFRTHPARSALDSSNSISINHHLIQLYIPEVLPDVYIMVTIDWMHIGWRLTTQYLDPRRRLAGWAACSSPPQCCNKTSRSSA